MIKAGVITIRSEIHTLINFFWNMEELTEVWKESITVLICKKGYKTDCSKYRGISLLLTMYKILFNILLSRLTPSSSSSVICQTTGSKPLPKRFLHIVRSRASSFNRQCPLLSLRSSSSFLPFFLVFLSLLFAPLSFLQ